MNNTTADILVGSSTCKTLSLIARWDLQVTPSSGDRLQLMGVRSAGTCSNNPPSPDVSFFIDNPPNLQTDSEVVTASQMALPADAGTPANCDDPDLLTRRSANPVTNILCLQYVTSGVITTGSVNIKYALAKPLPPIGIVVTPGNNHFRLDWSQGDKADTIGTFDVHVVPEGTTPDGGTPAHVTTTNVDIQRTDYGDPVQNDAGYAVTIIANDTYGNVSDPSAEVIAIPVPSSDFYDHYRNSGGSAEGGCATGGASAWVAGAGLALALLLRKRRRARDGAALVALFALLAPAARAQEPGPRFLIAFKIDKYDPKVDSEPGLSGTPYHDVFKSRVPLRYQLEFDWEALHHQAGSLMIGATAGFWQNFGKAVLLSSTPGNPQSSQDTALLNVWPFGVIATYRFDWLAQRWQRFPIIPYAQAGLSSALWVSLDGTGDVSSSSAGGRGKGWTYGYTTALGVALSLNAIDPGLAHEAYMDTGIQRTSFFAEYGWTYLSNFHKTGALILTDRAWRFGMAVEF
ncbi:MAG TPA: MXAN_2562 family outer membrane beta-barrel protein [Myxococcales bacterium]|nr:MXAN_2562 family outer membrane beta-barrel protein [Myxococcales bacterium]